MSPLGYQFHDLFMGLKEKRFTFKLQREGMLDVSKWINDNKENLEDNKYKGIYERKNLIFIQVESLDKILINNTINGQEVTPNLNRLIKNSLYFENIYEQNNMGSSSDCDLMVNSSVLPIQNEMTFYEYPDVKLENLASILKNRNYTTMSSHPESMNLSGGFNWEEAHVSALGFDNVYDSEQLRGEEFINMGLSDGEYLKCVENKIKDLKKPFYNYSVTLTSHGDFSVLPDKYKYLNLQPELKETILGNYFQIFRYTDEQIGKFINDIQNDEDLKDTVFVIYGDHSSLHKYYHDKIMEINTEEQWWKDSEKRIPLIIYTPGQKGEVIDTYGGQIDIMPTIAYLMGIDRSEFEDKTMGRILVNTERNSTILTGGIIKGKVKSEDEKKHLLESYNVSDKFIRGNYLEWVEKNK